MAMAKLRLAFRALAVAFVVAAPSLALAHTVMLTPQPRDMRDDHKTAPCGAIARTNRCTQYEAGATIPVKWMETVDHTGCFQIALSQNNDQNFTILKQINDPAGTGGAVYPDTVKLPPGVTCTNCTLVVRQLMIDKACTTAPFQNDLDASTYYSCADIRIGDFPGAAPCEPPVAPDAGPGTPDASSGGPTTVPTDGGGKLVDGGGTSNGGPVDLHSGDGGGCSVALGATSGVSFAVTVGLFGLALLRRRRRR
jgi:hypothetical protein